MGAGLNRRGLVVAVVLVVVLMVLVQNSIVRAPDLDYRPVDARTIELDAAVAPRSWTRVVNVVEDADEVRIRVDTLPLPIPLAGTSPLERRTLVIHLRDNLGDRRVEDADGDPIRPG